jgi:hypothetical protein
MRHSARIADFSCPRILPDYTRMKSLDAGRASDDEHGRALSRTPCHCGRGVSAGSVEVPCWAQRLLPGGNSRKIS